MKAEIKLIHTDGSEEYLTHLESEELREYGAEDLASLFVPRNELDPRDVDEGRTEAELRLGGDPIFRGPIEEVVRHDVEKEIIVESPERYAERAEPGAAHEPWENVADGEIIRDAVESVPELDPGAIDTLAERVTKQFAHASPAFKARKVEEISAGFVRYNPDLTVDFGRLGRDKTHHTLSPRRDNVEESVEVDRESGYEEVTHLRLLGAGEGEHQATAEAVADSWSQGDPEIWKSVPDTSIGDEETLEQKAETLVADMQTQLLEVELTAHGLDVRLGDRFRVYVPSEQVSDDLEVVEHKRVIDAKGVHHELVLSNHRDSRTDPEEKNRKDVENYNSAIEGSAQTLNISDGYQPVDPPDAPYRLRFLYPPEVEYEHRLNLRVYGEPYRTFSAGSLDNADFTSAFRSDTGNTTHTLELNEWTNLTTVVVPDDVESSTLYLINPVRVRGGLDPGDNVYLEFRYVKDDGYRIPDPTDPAETEGYEVRLSGRASSTVPFIDPVDTGGDEIDIEARVTEINAGDMTSEVKLDVSHFAIAAGKHAHAPRPGVIEAFEDDFDPEDPDPGPDAERFYPDDCTVWINGTEVATIPGDPGDNWSDTVDLRGELRKGEINEVVIEPGSIGGMSAVVEGYVYERVTGDLDNF